jgi:anaphase-promoting complex subunit 4
MPTGASTVCLGWASNSTLRRTNRAKSSHGKDWQSLVNEQTFDEGNSLDLPRDLALIDVESSIPKLSVLPVGGTS